MTTPVLPSAAEPSEAEALFDSETGAPAATREALGMRAVRLGGGVALSVRHDPTGFWSKALGFGFTTPVTADLVTEVCAFYRIEGTPQAVLQLAPTALPEDWDEICAKYGLSAGSSWVKPVCATDEALRRTAGWNLRPAGLNVAAVSPEDAVAWGAAMMRAFETPEEHLGDMTAASVGRDGRHPFGAWDGTDLVAVGTRYTRGENARFFGGATLPHARGRGAQSVLLAARARQADTAGCRWLVAETGVERPGPTTRPCTTCSASASRSCTSGGTGHGTPATDEAGSRDGRNLRHRAPPPRPRSAATHPACPSRRPGPVRAPDTRTRQPHRATAPRASTRGPGKRGITDDTAT